MITTLTEVGHVPDLDEKNLISLGTMESKGYKTIISNKLLWVSKGSKETKPVTSSATVASTEKLEAELTKLWHMSEKGMKILSKQGFLGDHEVADLEFFEYCIFGK